MNFFHKQLIKFSTTHPEVTMEIEDKNKEQIDVRIQPPDYDEIKITIGKDIKIERPGFLKYIKIRRFKKAKTYSDLICCLFNEAWERNRVDNPLPNIKEDEFITLNVDSNTGQVLTVNGNKYVGWGEVYLIHQSYEEAKTFARRMCTKKTILCYIYDHSHKVMIID